MIGQGLHIMGCGDRSFRFRPNLIFGTAHVAEALGVISSVVAKGV
jgi:4-aminobutyrate aminotransferase-like enzyme